MMSRWQARLIGIVVISAGLVACDSAGSGTQGLTGVLGMEGASCMRTPDCQPPLQCMANVCTGVATDAGSVGDGTVPDTVKFRTVDTGLPDSGLDLPWVHEIAQDADLSGWEIQDIPEPDSGPAPDTSGLGYDTLFGQCEELGIAPDWAGTFIGLIVFDLNDPYDLVYPDQGQMLVMGDLSFSISCMETKLVVDGTVEGTATVEEYGDFPFEIQITGYYSPKEQVLNAKMVDGTVTIFGAAQVYFEGDFNGFLEDGGSFSGTWDGEAKGTNLGEILTGEATGNGSWTADPLP